MSDFVVSELSEVQRQTLFALCDTLVGVETEGNHLTKERAFLARPAGDLGIPLLLEGLAPAGMLELLDGLAAEDFVKADVASRTRLVHAFAHHGEASGMAMREIKEACLAMFYALPDETGRNPNWDVLGYPGPVSDPPSSQQKPKTLRVERVSGDVARLNADAVVVGSGAGGAVIAAELQRAGLTVLVLEQGPYRNEADFTQLELVGMLDLYLGGGITRSERGSIGLLAGSCLGGGTIVNSLVCLKPPPRILAEWEALGLVGVSGPEFQDDLDTVWNRLSANSERTHPNRSNEKLMVALEQSGLSWQLLARNASSADDPRYCGYCITGCQRGAKQSTLVTYLQDASDAGANVLVDCHVERILTNNQGVDGVASTVTHEDGTTTSLIVEAPLVVVAAGGLGTPALLLRSGLGGPAVGKHLHLHPAYFVGGIHDETIDGWAGQFQAIASFDFAEAVEGYGFVVESVNASASLWAAGIPWIDGLQHKREMLKLRNILPWHAVCHDHGEGEVVLDSAGEPLVRWELTDSIDQEVAIRAHVELARLHRAAGAKEIFTFHWDEHRWREGDDFDAFLRKLEQLDHGRVAFSAHQMCSCRMGLDPSDSVADPRGQLHDTPGVWIGDSSAMPTPPGVNPMISIMALAHRTARFILADRQE